MKTFINAFGRLRFKVPGSRPESQHQFHILFLLLFGGGLLPIASFAQTLKGVVHGHSDEGHVALVGANVVWSGTTVGTVTDADGRFSLAVNEGLPAMLVVSYVGYTSDTITITSTARTLEVDLDPAVLEGVTISERQSGSISS
jgi:outer membrane receptor for ferrienterochelin and colicins